MTLIIGPRLALALREETGFDVTGHPDFIVHDPNRPGAADIEIRPGTVKRMAAAAEEPPVIVPLAELPPAHLLRG